MSLRTEMRLFSLPLLALLLTAILLSAISAQAEESMLPVKQQVPLLLKVLTYERTLMQSEAPVVRVGFLVDPSAASSQQQFEEFEREFRAFADKTLRGHNVTLLPIPFAPSARGDLPPEANAVNVIFVPPSNPRVIPLVQRWTRTRKILSATSVDSYVEAGLSLGLVVRNGRTSVRINRTASREEGLVWVEEFLALCRVID